MTPRHQMFGLMITPLFAGLMIACGSPAVTQVKTEPQMKTPETPKPPDRREIPRIQPPPPGSIFVSIVIDDCGESIEQVVPFLTIPVPLSFGILPYHREAAQTSRTVTRMGHEAIVHAPMEPRDPRWLENDWFLRSGMTPRELEDRLKMAMEAVPTATGMNNHMGSRICADRAAMDIVMRFLKDKGLYYLDSRTTRDSAAAAAAGDAGLRFLSRDIFLDNDDDVDAVGKQIEKLVSVARKKGCAVGIGHARSNTAAAIMNYYRARDPGVVFVPAGRLFDLCPDPGQSPPE